jgi:hypothetical protein
MGKARFGFVIIVTLAMLAGWTALAVGTPGVSDEGVGLYTDASVANQISGFTINPEMVSCGVGTLANGQFSGPFAMLMYTTNIQSYTLDRSTLTINATGKMRSITHVAGQTVENVEHDFVALAVDKLAAGPDRFDVHFKTPFWATSNAMCTASTVVSGGCRFGGNLVMGEINVSSTGPTTANAAGAPSGRLLASSGVPDLNRIGFMLISAAFGIALWLRREKRSQKELDPRELAG